MHLHDFIVDKAKDGDATFAVAYAILKLAEEQHRLARAVDALGANMLSPTAGMGTTEFIGKQLEQIAEALLSRE